MTTIGLHRIAGAIARNQAHRLIGGAWRGGHRTQRWSDIERRNHARGIFETLGPHLGDVAGRTGLEIGPGDNLGVCELLLAAGCKSMYAAEKFAVIEEIPHGVQVVQTCIEDLELAEPVDFIISNDVLEHVTDPAVTMTRAFQALRPGGRFVSSVDLRGHNVFNLPHRPLEFLTCPDWLYALMTSHIETSNRVRRSDLLATARSAGFEVLLDEPLDVAGDAHLLDVRPRLIDPYQPLPDDDLRVLQILLVLERPR